MTTTERLTWLDAQLHRKYGIGLEAMELTDVPGTWQAQEPKMHPGHPLHRGLFCEGPFKATYTWYDSSRLLNGRFASRYRTWQALREASLATREGPEREERQMLSRHHRQGEMT